MKKRILFLAFLIGIAQQLLAQSANFTVTTTCGSGDVQFTNTSTSFVNAQWNFGNGVLLTTTTGNPLITYTNPGIYNVVLTVTDASGLNPSTQNISFFVPAKHGFTYGDNICMSTSITGGVLSATPQPAFSGLNGSYKVLTTGLSSYFDQPTGKITFSSNISSFTYTIQYSYSVPGCSLGSTTSTTTVGLGYAVSGPISGSIITTACNRIDLTIVPTAKGSLQWQVSIPGSSFQDLPSTGESLGSLVNPFNESFKNDYITPTITTTSIIRATLSDPVCGTLYSDNTLLFTIAGLSKAGNLSIPNSTICLNSSPVLSLSGYLGRVQWQYSTDGISYTNDANTTAQTIPGIVGTTYNTTHAATSSIFSTTGNVFFRASVLYQQYGLIGSCDPVYSNVITISPVFCTVTSAIVNTTTSPICLSSSSTVGVMFNSSVVSLVGSVATVTSYLWNFGSGANPATSVLSTPGIVKYTSASSTIKTISLTVSGPGISYISSTTLQIDALSSVSGILPSSNLTLCGGNVVILTVSGYNNTSIAGIIWLQSSNQSVYTTATGIYYNPVYTTPGLSNDVYYKAMVKNGVCPAVTTAGSSFIKVLPPLTILPNFDSPVVTLCEGLNTTLTASGINGSIIFKESTDAISYTAATALSGTYTGTGSFATKNFTVAGVYYYQAEISNPYSCTTAGSGIYTVSVVSCPIMASFTTAGALFMNRACQNNSGFTITDLTPTINGVNFTAWQWDLGQGSSKTPFTTTTGNAISTSYSTPGIKIIQLTISGVAGVKSYFATASGVVTVDGLSTATGISSSASATTNNICKNNSATLTVTGTNSQADIQWQNSLNSITGWANMAGANSVVYSTATLTTTTYYKALVTNGVCPVYTSPGVGIEVVPDVSITPIANQIINKCSGENIALSANINFGDIHWEQSVPGINWQPVTTGTGFTTTNFISDYLASSINYRASVTDYLGCLTTTSGIFTVSVTSCPIQPVISVTSAFSSGRTCASSPMFTFADITPTIAGVTFTKWEWNFSSNGQPTTFSGKNPGMVTFLGSDIYPIVSLTITGLSGITETSYIKSITLTVDGISTATGILSSTINNNTCKNNAVNLSVTGINPLGVIQWQQSVASSVSGWTNVSIGTGANSTLYITPPLTLSGYYRALVANGVCSVFSTDGVWVNILPDISINPTTDATVKICEGEHTTLVVSGANGDIQWRYTPDNGINWLLVTTTTGMGSTSSSFTTDYLFSTQKYRAYINDVLGCMTSVSGVFTVSVTSCAFTPVISVTSAFSPTRTCASSPVFTFADITPTITGVTFTKWSWDFSSNGQPTTFSGKNPGIVTFSGSDIYPVVSLTITGLSGVTETNYTKSIILTVDGISSASGISSTTINNNSCKNTPVSLSVTGTNPSAYIQWQSSIVNSLSGWVNVSGGTGANSTQYTYTTDPLFPSVYYRTLVTNGVCPVFSTAGVWVNILPDISLSSTADLTVNLCNGQKTTLSVTGINGDFQWQETLDNGAHWFDVSSTVGTGATTSAFTTDYLFTTKIYRAKISDILQCMTSISGIYTISVTSCPIQPVISVTSAVLPQRTCYSDPNFTFSNITPTIAGVTFIKWDWDFGSNFASTQTLSTTTGQGKITVNYYEPFSFISTIKQVQLTITGVSGINTFTGISLVNITIDGIPTIPGFRSTDATVCSDDPDGTYLNLDIFNINPAPLNSSAFKWYVSTAPGVPYTQFTPSPLVIPYPTGVLTTTTSYIVTAENGVCPTFTTPSVIILVVDKPEIQTFLYTTPLCNDQTTNILPSLNRTGSTTPGTYFVSSSNSNEFIINHANGSFKPSDIVLSANTESYTITYSIPGFGGCAAVSTVTSVDVGKKLNTPIFSYNSAPYCSNQLNASKAVNTGEGLVLGSYYASGDIGVNSVTGVVSFANITASGVYNVAFTIPALAGCPAIITPATLTVTGAPTQPSFTYSGNQYCSDIGIITVSSSVNTDDPLGYWEIAPSSNISISSITGTISLTGATLTDYYFITYTKPPRGGCYTSAQTQKAIFVSQLPATPYFDYGGLLPQYCSNAAEVSVANFTGPGIGFYATNETSIYVSATTGKITIPSNTVSGIKNIEYIINPSGACTGHTVVATAQVNFLALPEPSFGYEKLYMCNNSTFELHPINLVDVSTTAGTFYYTNSSGNSLYINSITGVVTVTSATGQDFYNVYYKTPLLPTCGTGDIVSKKTVTLFIEQLPETPYFSYGDQPICSNSPKNPISVTGLGNNVVFSAPVGFSINPNDGTLYPSNQLNGQYVITCTNRSVVSINNVITTTCPLVSNIAVVTIGSDVSIPPFNYGKDKFCSDEGPKSLLNTLTGGYFYSNAGLTLNTLTGDININTSSLSGNITTYQIYYRIDRLNGCSSVISSTGISIYKKQTLPVISYPKTEYCQNDLNPSPLGAYINGYFSAPSDISINSVSGLINLSSSSARQNVGIAYIIPASEGCPILSTTTSVSITAPETPVLSYGNAAFCNSNTTQPVPYIVQPANGTFTGSFGLNIESLSGKVTLAGSPVGISQITYTAPDKGACRGSSIIDNITITSPITTPYFKYVGSPFCHSGSVLPIGSFQYGSFRASTNIQFITSVSGLSFKDTTAGEIDLKNSIPGEKYYISYIVPSIGGCEPIIVQDTISIRTAKIGSIKSEAEKGLICGGNTIDINLLGEYFGTLTWQKMEQTDSLWSISDGTLNSNTFTTEKLNDTTYFRVKADYNNCPDSVYSNKIKIRVIPASFGGTATTDDNTDYKLICNEFSTLLKVTDYRGSIVWQFSDDDSFWEDVDPNKDTLATFQTKSQNQYGNKRWFRSRVTNATCPSDYSNAVLVQVCDNVLFVPNALTPGTGNHNSYWDLTKLNLRDDADIKVFNRYGSVIYTAKGSQVRVLENCWDGSGLPTGTYYYIIDKRDQSQPLAGSVSIVK